MTELKLTLQPEEFLSLFLHLQDDLGHDDANLRALKKRMRAMIIEALASGNSTNDLSEIKPLADFRKWEENQKRIIEERQAQSATQTIDQGR